jgi:hypothetical protein
MFAAGESLTLKGSRLIPRSRGSIPKYQKTQASQELYR